MSRIFFISCIETLYPKTKSTFLDKIFSRSKLKKAISSCALSFIHKHNHPNFKINNRYVFKQMFGCYEFLSVLFCFVNLLQTIKSFSKFKKILSQYKKTKKKTAVEFLYSIYFYLAFITNIGSICLHIDQNEYTLLMDYFPVFCLSIYCSFLFSVKSMFILGVDSKAIKLFRRCFLYLGVSFSTMFLGYSVYKFDSRLHKNVNTFFVAVYLLNLIFQSFMFARHRLSSNKARNIKVAVCFCLTACVFEFLDFPPVFMILDSHSMWHFFIMMFFKYKVDYIIGDIRDILEEHTKEYKEKNN